MDKSPISVGGLQWHVEAVPLSSIPCLKASIVSACVWVSARGDDVDLVTVEFGQGGIPQESFPAATFRNLLEVARELVDRVAAVRGVTDATSNRVPQKLHQRRSGI